MQNPRHVFGVIDEPPQPGRRQPNCPAPGEGPIFDAWGPPRDERFIAADIDADLDIGSQGHPRDRAFAMVPQLSREAGPAAICRR